LGRPGLLPGRALPPRLPPRSPLVPVVRHHSLAGQLLATAGDNPERMRSEGAFAHLAGVAPIPASSGRTHRHRLNRGGDRAANNALHTIVLTRMRFDERTRAYVERRTKEGLNKKDIMRCLKRFVAREVYRALTSTPTERITQTDLAPAA
ncbi:IS110 family transposase, partial [Streptomyces hirsutus]|uniref:IS110 family transposase n=1 Tax=Streptomyces hirsutus TaxID=35620 RepID=UPI003401C759